MLNGKEGAALIAEERDKQKQAWSNEHDDTHTANEIGLAAAALIVLDGDPGFGEDLWPWEEGDLKRHYRNGRIDNLITAGALIAAELDRELRRIGF